MNGDMICRPWLVGSRQYAKNFMMNFLPIGQEWQGLVIYPEVDWHVLFHCIEQGLDSLVFLVVWQTFYHSCPWYN
jgi:hypothetical protein